MSNGTRIIINISRFLSIFGAMCIAGSAWHPAIKDIAILAMALVWFGTGYYEGKLGK